MPLQVLERFAALAGEPADRAMLIRGFGTGLVMLGVATAFERDGPPRLGAGLVVALAVAAFVLLTLQLSSWWIDDAGITFSYSRSLAEGAGVTFQPGEPPTEGYSSSLWMLILAGAGALGLDIPMAAKVLGTAFGAAAMVVAMRLAWLMAESLVVMAATAAAVMTAPFVTWSASGQEHALQALLLVLAILAARQLRRWRLPVTVLLCLLVLTRPEAPILVAALFATMVIAGRHAGWARAIRRTLPLGLAPFVVFCLLIAWRLAYFGDPLPNPYYAKTAGSSFAGVLNPFGGGWVYLLDGLRDSGLLLVAALPFLADPRDATERRPLRVLLALLLGHAFFVIWAKGDWMGQYRFLMPVVPLIVVAAIPTLARIGRDGTRVVAGVAIAVTLLSVTVRALDGFAARPTTPLSVVSTVGRTFATLADRLGIDAPLLAHHDAGAISYDRSIALLDLGGLVDRDVAHHMDDRAYLERYVLEERRPDFLFGAVNFAARTRFWDTPDFHADYVPLVFEDRPVMDSDLSYVRRDRLREGPGLRIERDDTGRAERLVMRP